MIPFATKAGPGCWLTASCAEGSTFSSTGIIRIRAGRYVSYSTTKAAKLPVKCGTIWGPLGSWKARDFLNGSPTNIGPV